MIRQALGGLVIDLLRKKGYHWDTGFLCYKSSRGWVSVDWCVDFVVLSIRVRGGKGSGHCVKYGDPDFLAKLEDLL